MSFLQFLPVVRRAPGSGVTAETVPAEAYGEFLCAVFREWVRRDIGRIGVQILTKQPGPTSAWNTRSASFERPAVDSRWWSTTGISSPVTTYVDREHYMGNLRERSLVEMLESPAQIQFGRNKQDALPARVPGVRRALSLQWGAVPKIVCWTPKTRAGAELSLRGLKRFFIYSRPYLQRLAEFHKTGKPVEQFMQLVRSEEAAGVPTVGRNDPCPCGSGKNTKNAA